MNEQDYTPATGAKPAASPAGKSSPSSPASELKKLKDDGAQDQQKVDTLKKQMDERQAKIKELEKAMAATSQVTTAFAAAMQGVSTDRLEIQEFLTHDLPRLKKSDDVKQNKEEIESTIAEVDATLADKKKALGVLKTALDAETAALQTANNAQSAKKLALDALKDRQRTIQDGFAQMRKLRQRIEKEGDKPAVQYALALELDKEWKTTTALFMTTEELEADYYARADEVRAATAAALAQEVKQKAAQTEYDTARKELDGVNNARVDDIVKKVSGIATGAAVGAGVPGKR